MSQTDTDFDDEFEAVQRADRVTALRLAKHAADKGGDHPLVLVLAAEWAEQAGDLGRATTLLAKATSQAPDDAEPWRRYGMVLTRTEQLGPALAAFARALAILPNAYPTLMAAGSAAFELGELQVSQTYYKTAQALNPDQAQPLAALSAIAARREDSISARALASEALVREPQNAVARLATARADLLDGAPLQAAQRVSRLLEDPDLDPQSRIVLHDLRGDAYDAADLTDQAFAEYAARNAITDRIYAPRIAREAGERRIDQARRLRTYFAETDWQRWRAACPADAQAQGDVAGHIFLLSFPRSGTTLLEKALAGHPDVVSMEEVNVLEGASADLMSDAASLDRLRDLTPAQARDYRHVYWAGVAKDFDRSLAGKTLLDKLPLHTARLPVIAKLFPQAKVLFALRDPRDVVFSCFRRRFQVNSAMYELLTLERAANYYDAVMSLAQLYRDHLPLKLLEVRHEAAVADFAGECRKVLAFLELPWNDAVVDFAARARARPRTPSDMQLAHGLNNKGLGQWRRYAKPMAEVENQLAPWVDHFGYDA